MPNPQRRRFLKQLVGGVVGAALLGGAGYAQGYGLGVTRYSRPLPGLRAPLTVAFLTDLHYGLFMGVRELRRWVDTTNSLHPDLVLFGGDFMDRHLRGVQTVPPELLAELGRLRAPLGCYGVWGNHDYGVFGEYTGRRYGPAETDWQTRREQFERAFGAAGIKVLRNTGQAVRPDLYLGGVDDLWHGQPDPAAALAGARAVGAAAPARAAPARILLCHNPDILPELPALLGGPAQQAPSTQHTPTPPPGLMLCGHTHGGQVRLPLVGAIAPAVPSKYGTRYAMGWVLDTPLDIATYVSRGLGMSGIPFRNLCEPEIVYLKLLPT